MAGHSHDDHHVTEQKPVSFTVPFILAAVTILIMVLFLSLCDPKPHSAHHGEENAAHSQFKGETHEVDAVEGQEASHSDHATTVPMDTTQNPPQKHAGEAHH